MGYKFNPFTGNLDLAGFPSNGVVSGSGSSTDNAVVRFDGTSGTVIQSSGVTIDDSNNIVTSGTVTSDGNIDNSLTANRAVATNGSKQLVSSTTTDTELGYVNGVTSAIQTQLNGKQSSALASAHILVGNGSNLATDVAVSGDLTLDNTGNFQIVAGTIVNADINASAAIDATKIADGSVTNTEFQYINSVTSNVQTQIDNITSGTTPLALTSAHIFVGNGSNQATDVAVTGDISINNTGVVAISTGVIVNADINASAAIDASKIADGSVSSTEFQYLDGVTSAIQTQLNGKQTTALTSAHILVGNGSNLAADVAVTGDISIDNAGLTAISSGVIVNADINASAAIDASKIADGSVSSTEFQYLDGVTSAIQTQLNARLLKASGDINETSFTAADNQVAAANVTGLAFANGTVRSFEAILSIVRSATYSQYKLNGIQGASSWYFSQNYLGDDAGLVFSITTAGQVQYTSTSTGSTAAVNSEP